MRYLGWGSVFLLCVAAVGCDTGTTPAADADTGSTTDGGGGTDGGRMADSGRDTGLDGNVSTNDTGVMGDGGMDASICSGRTTCPSAGTSCTGDTLVTCAADADGCLVPTNTDCTATSTQCLMASGAASCEDVCAGVPAADRCTTASRVCTTNTLDVCAADIHGCLVVTHTDCAAAAGGVCDTTGTMPVCRSTADPCAGHPACGTAASRSCTDSGHLSICDVDSFGCYVATVTDCGATGDVCDTTHAMPMCADPCTVIPTCASANYCNGTNAVTCSADTNGCLVQTGTTACAMGCTASTGMCTELCAPATGHVLTCGTTTTVVMGDTASGTAAINAYSCAGALTYAGNEVVYRFSNPHLTGVHMVATRISGTGDFDLFALDSVHNTVACSASSTCTTSSRSATSAMETIDFTAQADEQTFISYDLYSGTGTTTFSLAVTCVEPVCGDGMIQTPYETCDDSNGAAGDGCSGTCMLETGSVCYGAPSVCGTALTCGNGIKETGEGCDDHNTANSDGCSSTCQVEPNFICSGGAGGVTGAPSVCSGLDTNSTCAGATAVTATTTINIANSALGGTAPTGTTCSSAGGPTHYYAVTIPPMASVVVSATSAAFDTVLKTKASCGAADCLMRIDSTVTGGTETTTLGNAGSTAITRIVAVNPYSTTNGAATVTFTYGGNLCGNGTLNSGEACDDGNNADVDGCSATCTVESGYSCGGTPSVCTMQAANATCAGATPVTSTGTLTFPTVNTTTGGASPTGTVCGPIGGNTLYYAVTIPPMSAVRVDAQSSTVDLVIKTKATCGAADCDSRTDSGVAGPTAETRTLSNPTGAAVTRIVAVNSFSTTMGTASVTFTYLANACGDGAIQVGEACDDGNGAIGDGCTTCAVDSGYACTGTPSVCVMTAANSMCASATSLGVSGTATGYIGSGGARPTGAGCTSAAGPVLWYSVTVPANSVTSVVVQPSGPPSWDPVISVNPTCAATGCAASTNAHSAGASEGISITNATGVAITRVIAVGANSATVFGTFTIRVASVVQIAAACVDVSGGTVLPWTTGSLNDGATNILPLPFAFSFFGTAETNYSMTTNGYVQVYPSASGTPATDYSNVEIPTISTPNGFIAPFWDDLGLAVMTVLTTGTAGSQVFVVDWNASDRIDSSTNTVHFQAMLFEGSNNIEFHYCNMSTTGTSTGVTGLSATIGLESGDGLNGTRISYNTPATVTTGSGYRFVP